MDRTLYDASLRAGALGIALVVATVPAIAADLTPPPGTVLVDEPGGLAVSAAAYVWGASMTGSVGVGRLGPVDVDASFGDILSNLDFAFMAVAEARYDRFGVFGDLLYTRLSAEGSGPGGRLEAKVSNDLLIATLMAEARVVEAQNGSLDLLAGGRVWDLGADLKLSGPRRERSADRSETWIDPMFGAKGRLDVTGEVFLSGWAMAGGFGAGSDFGWDLFAGVGYEINDRVSIIGGYRGLGVDYRTSDFRFDVIQHGPVVSGLVRF